MNYKIFRYIRLDHDHTMYSTEIIPEFNWDSKQFMELWDTHPLNYHTIRIRGKEIPTPRWQQAYGKNYRYSGSLNNALPINDLLLPFLNWSRENVDERLNGLLLNWYDGQKGHYIGPHRDDTRDLYADSPIVTISLGQERIFRLRPLGRQGFHDIIVRNGSVVIMPAEINKRWTHEIPKMKKYDGKRISVTLRAFRE